MRAQIATKGCLGGQSEGLCGARIDGVRGEAEHLGARDAALALEVLVQAGQLGTAVYHLVRHRGPDAAAPDQQALVRQFGVARRTVGRDSPSRPASAISFSNGSPGRSVPSLIAAVSCSASWWYSGTGLD